MTFIRIRDLDVYYEVQGEGPPLLFINGTGGDLRTKPNIFDSPLPRAFTLLAYDQRGLGQTSVPETQPTMRDFAEDAHALVRALDWPRCSVYGVSFGGMVAQELAIRFPERVSRLVLACTSSGGVGATSYPLHELNDLTPRERALRMIALSDTRRDAAWQAENPEALELLIEQTARERTAGVLMQLEARRLHDTYDRLGSLTMPVYVCGGEYDGIAPKSNLEALAAQIPGAQLQIFDGGHLFMIQDQRARPAMVAFLQE